MQSYRLLHELEPLVQDGVLQLPSSARLRFPVDVPWSVNVAGHLVLDKQARFGGDVTVRGHVDAYRSLAAGGNLAIRGGLFAIGSVSAGGSIEARTGIVVQGRIRAGASIATQGELHTDAAIEAKTTIDAGKDIRAAQFIRAGGRITAASVLSLDFDVACTELVTKTLPLGRSFWASLSVLSRHRDAILDAKNCWDELRALPGDDERRGIASVPLHWTLQAQLSNFLGLTNTVTPPEGK